MSEKGEGTSKVKQDAACQVLGSHMTTWGGLYKAVEKTLQIKGNTLQIFTANNKSWKSKDVEPKDAQQFKDAVTKAGLKGIMSHAAYIINLGSSKEDVRENSIKSLTKELQRSTMLNIPFVVLHPGAHTGAGAGACIKHIAQGLDTVLESVPGDTMILLETAAGQGTTVGKTFAELKSIYDLVKNKPRIGICLDTCHVFAAGYDIANESGYKKLWEEFEKTLGLNLLKAIHLNDSKTEVGAHKDRHESIGHGKIPLETFWFLMNDPRLAAIPKVLETPVNNVSHTAEIEFLKGMVGAEVPPTKKDVPELNESGRRKRKNSYNKDKKGKTWKKKKNKIES